MKLPPWAEYRVFLTAPQLAIIMGFTGLSGQWDEVKGRAYARRYGLARINEFRKTDPTFPEPEYPHGETGRPMWRTDSVRAWAARSASARVAGPLKAVSA